MERRHAAHHRPPLVSELGMSELGIERIVLILEPGGEHRAAIQAAIDLASTLDLPLATIFAEDEALFDVATLSLAVHLDLGNQMSRALEVDLLSAAIAVEAQRCRDALDLTAREAGIRTTFSEWRGQPTLANIGVRGTDLVIVEGFSRPLTGQARLRSSWPRRLTTDGASVLVLNQGLVRKLVIGSLQDGEKQPRAHRIAAPLAAKLGGSVVYLQRDEPHAASALARRSAELKCDMLVLDAADTDPAICAALVAEGSCSVLILRRP